MPEDIESVVAGAVEDAGDVGGGESDGAVDTGVDDGGGAVTEPVVAEGAAADPAAVVEDPFAKEHGLVQKRPDGRENRIPYSRVKAIADNQVKKVVSQIAKELGITKAEAELKLEDVTGALTERSTKLTDYEARLAEIESIEQIMSNEPERFMRMMAQANPAYQRFAAVLEQAQEAAKQEAKVDDDPAPQPDYPLGDGKMTYSMEGLEKRMAWERRQATKAAKADFDKELAPIKERHKTEAEKEEARQKQVQYEADATKRILAQLDKAKTWPQFEENHKDILAAFNADKTLSLHDAYLKVMMPKFAADRTTMRQQLMDELKKAPAATSTTTTTTAAKTGEGDSIEDIIRASVASLGKKAA